MLCIKLRIQEMMKFAFFAFSASEQPDRAELNGSFPEKPEPEANSASSSDSEDTEGPEEGFDNDDDANVSKVYTVDSCLLLLIPRYH